MTAAPHGRVTEPAGKGVVTHDTAAEFVDLLIADDEWVRREFDALVNAGWDDVVPPCPAQRQRARWPRRPGYDGRSRPVQRQRDLLRGVSANAHQRGPPER
jgi:hypothetical protein